MIDLTANCHECGNQLMAHTMYFDHLDGEDFIRVNVDKPLKCPLGQLSDLIFWEDALRPIGVVSG